MVESLELHDDQFRYFLYLQNTSHVFGNQLLLFPSKYLRRIQNTVKDLR